jgi:hypothetical protein
MIDGGTPGTSGMPVVDDATTRPLECRCDAVVFDVVVGRWRFRAGGGRGEFVVPAILLMMGVCEGVMATITADQHQTMPVACRYIVDPFDPKDLLPPVMCDG